MVLLRFFGLLGVFSDLGTLCNIVQISSWSFVFGFIALRYVNFEIGVSRMGCL